MARDPNKLKVFELADQLMINVYRATQRFPVAERFGIQSQLRRAALSIPTNVVEGCARQTLREYLRVLSIALGSALKRDTCSTCRSGGPAGRPRLDRSCGSPRPGTSESSDVFGRRAVAGSR
ncbi:MAG: four helix bundle protein [Myxococcales bacterium]